MRNKFIAPFRNAEYNRLPHYDSIITHHAHRPRENERQTCISGPRQNSN